ncbi:LysR family transcriptional regulator [Bacillus sp. AFS041924]|uniref:LysR family transcriptional regulator n=1 Tax=Bacillus sp. AFS041924 TaxID=2033503 RepID=UPI000BFC6305|nr:LysR family transcriptional regulator [Bacillus sp. AFS041924]PGS49635.1 hypothetical protein COC46_14670 [Bacillus sp. AFS041924]
MNIEQLNHFSEVIKSGSFKLAAQKFAVSESVIKELMHSLEKEIDLKLIDCDGISKVVPTFEGLKISSLVKEVLLNYHELEEVVEFLRKDSIENGNLMYDVSIL